MRVQIHSLNSMGHLNGQTAFIKEWNPKLARWRVQQEAPHDPDEVVLDLREKNLSII